MSNTFSKLKTEDNNHNTNILQKLISLDEIINQRKILTLEEKLNMSLDEIIEHKKIYDEEYYKELETELDNDLQEYYQHQKLNQELVEYFKQKTKQDEKSKEGVNKIDNKIYNKDFEIIEWDYWGVTKTPNSELIDYEIIPSSPIKELNTKQKPKKISSKKSKKKYYKMYYKNKNLMVLLKNYKSLNTLLEERIHSLVKKVNNLERKIIFVRKLNNQINKKQNTKSKTKKKLYGKKIYYNFISK